MKLPQLHVRDLFWLLALVAMGLGWWVDHRRFTVEMMSLRLERLESEFETMDEILEAVTLQKAQDDKEVVRLRERARSIGLEP